MPFLNVENYFEIFTIRKDKKNRLTHEEELYII